MFQGHWLIGSGEEDILQFLPYTCMGMVATLDGRTDGRMTDDGQRTMKSAYTISSPGAFGSEELKINFHFFPYKSLCDQI